VDQQKPGRLGTTRWKDGDVSSRGFKRGSSTFWNSKNVPVGAGTSFLVDEVDIQVADCGGVVFPGGDLGLRARPGEVVEPGFVEFAGPI
jgi:hypothetical protein